MTDETKARLADIMRRQIVGNARIGADEEDIDWLIARVRELEQRVATLRQVCSEVVGMLWDIDGDDDESIEVVESIGHKLVAAAELKGYEHLTKPETTE